MPEMATDVEGNPIDVEGTPAAAEPATPAPDTSPPEEGNDQDASEGTDAPEVGEGQLKDAPEDSEEDGA